MILAVTVWVVEIVWGSGEDGVVVSGVVCVGTSLALGEVLREVWVG